ncbi:ATP-dependent DNA helicase Q1-like [Saccostrea cucullata]|uniref:ATP-dependent DNA helicase Q1-like n=1 Tax=Saccostrea cuccullata TaxID=36930 RepID=UPI002ED3C5A8
MEESLEFARNKLGIDFSLKEKQLETLKNLWERRDVISVLPTGYGKSVLYQLLPWFLQGERERAGIVIVIAPLTSIIVDQVSFLSSKGVKALCLNFEGTGCRSADDEEETVSKLVTKDMQRITDGDVEILYSHPEAIFSKKFGRILRSKVFQEGVCCVTIDEVHMIEEWGEEFRPKFKKLGDLTCLFPSAAHLSLTATATETSIESLGKVLQYINPVIIKANPDRPNIFLEKIVRPPNINKVKKLDTIIEPLCEELKEKRENFPVTIVYVENLESLGYFYQYVNSELREHQYVGEPNPENRIFAQFHKDYTEAMKSHVITELKKGKPYTTFSICNSCTRYGFGCQVHYQDHPLQTPYNT